MLERGDLLPGETPPDRKTYIHDVHGPLVTRCTMLGLSPDQIAWVLGVKLPTLKVWTETYPELREAARKGRLKDLELIEAAFDLAVGRLDKNGNRVGASPDLLKFLLKSRLKMSDRPEPAKPGGVIDVTDPKELGKTIRNVLQALDDEDSALAPTNRG